MNSTGFPSPSTIACSFVFSPPLVRPTALSAVFPPSVSTFVNLDAGRVQAQVFHIRICGQCAKYGLQCAIVPPFGESGIHRLPGPYASGSSRHCAPLWTIQSIPFSILRSSFRGRPRFPVLSGGSSSFTRSHCSFVNSYRFISLFSHLPTICAIFIFQTRPKAITGNPLFLFAFAVILKFVYESLVKENAQQHEPEMST